MSISVYFQVPEKEIRLIYKKIQPDWNIINEGEVGGN